MLGSLLAGKPLLLMLAQSALSSMDAVERAQKDFHVKVVAKRDTA
jgi:hypothetical protein